jgi:molecular chaperone GrpE
MTNPRKEDNIFDEVADGDPAEAAPGQPEAPAAEAAPEAPAAADTGPEPVGPDVEALVAERDELKDRLLRALAEADNVRKRADRDRREAEAYGATRLARDLLPIYDNLKRALDAADDNVREHSAAMLEGVELTQRELLNIFHKHKIERIAPEPGDAFDPQLHQAMFEAPVPDVPKGHIIQVMTEGFLLHERLLRPAQVGVSSRPAS